MMSQGGNSDEETEVHRSRLNCLEFTEPAIGGEQMGNQISLIQF